MALLSKMLGLYAMLAALLAAAIWSDLRSHRIPNLLVVAGLIAALVGQAVVGGWSGLGHGMGGALLGLFALLPFYLMGGMGAGDVKLMAAVGAFLGPLQTLAAAALTLVFGAVMALFVLGLRRGARKSVGQLRDMTLSLALTHRPITDSETRLQFTYAPAIALGTFATSWWTLSS